MQWLDHATMRDVAIEALGGIGPESAAAIESIALVAADDQEPLASRCKAINALVRIGGPKHPFVAAALELGKADSDQRVGLAISEALKFRRSAEAPAHTLETHSGNNGLRSRSVTGAFPMA
ncbi:MAG: hypothetical protein R3F19_00765 [Verrucomicrobiales bacterium]